MSQRIRRRRKQITLLLAPLVKDWPTITVIALIVPWFTMTGYLLAINTLAWPLLIDLFQTLAATTAAGATACAAYCAASALHTWRRQLQAGARINAVIKALNALATFSLALEKLGPDPTTETNLNRAFVELEQTANALDNFIIPADDEKKSVLSTVTPLSWPVIQVKQANREFHELDDALLKHCGDQSLIDDLNELSSTLNDLKAKIRTHQSLISSRLIKEETRILGLSP